MIDFVDNLFIPLLRVPGDKAATFIQMFACSPAEVGH
jgi:hypothetical protein